MLEHSIGEDSAGHSSVCLAGNSKACHGLREPRSFVEMMVRHPGRCFLVKDGLAAGCRYDPQIAVFGRTMQRRLSALNLFLVSRRRFPVRNL